ncbi:hypothetical protein J437_LFUL002147 [Ladona fulva]|uniref:Dynein attachment factor N-terminal domain-containing protein n=1 Tax=Ladona fulva TaxID=123851 RepID=A0A8K0JY61_LADFU|nr:hypothetical protein J437_LFUL002147 [Ladona fulva]
MDSRKYTPVDPFKLEIQLLKAIEEDSNHKREDAAKFRAAGQSKNYEEFRDIVKAAHLKPLEKKDSLRHLKIGLVSWNRTAKRGCWRSDIDKSLSATTNNFESPAEDVLNAPMMQRDFEQHWASLSNFDKRITLLQRVIDIDSFFVGKDLSIDVTESLIKALLESLDPKNALPSREKVNFVLKVMISISSSSRFSLNLQLLSDQGRENIRNLLNMVTELLEEETDLVNSKEVVRDLTNKYNCW